MRSESYNNTPEFLTENITRIWAVHFGQCRKRISIKHTRAMLTAALEGSLDQVDYVTDPWFGFEIPLSCPGVPDQILNPSGAWSDQDAYQERIAELVGQFKKNMKKYQDSTPQEVLLAGPK